MTTTLNRQVKDLAKSVKSPARYAHSIAAEKFLVPRHIKHIDRAIIDTVKGRSAPVLIVEAPPRHGKSEFISKYLPAWYLSIYPENRVALCSYEHNFARSWGRKAKAIFSDNSHLLGVSISREQYATSDWETSHGGGMMTAGVGGPLTGRGANLLIIDDYLKNSEQAFSEAIRENQWDWWQSTASTRLEPGGIAIIIATRWHKDDLIGRLLKQHEDGEIEVRRIRLPAVAEHNDALGREPGEPLWPDRFPVEALEAKRKSMDLYWWLAMYQQRPAQHDKSEWPESYFGEAIWSDYWPDRFEWSVMAIDPSKGRSASKGDYSAIVHVGISGGLFWITSSIKRRPAEQIVADAMEMQRRTNSQMVGLEANAWQDLLAPIMTEYCVTHHIPEPPIYLISNTVNKQLRIGRLGPYLQNSKFRLNSGCEDNKILLTQLQEFPLSDHDDGPDALEMAMRLLGEAANLTPQSGETVVTI